MADEKITLTDEDSNLVSGRRVDPAIDYESKWEK